MKNILITLDYELFFGGNSGTVENCMLKPTKKLLEVLDRQKVKATFFVDCGYLVRAKAEKTKSLKLVEEYQKVIEQIKKLDSEGHNIQLHIHPHWEDSYHDGNKWIMNTSRYKLHDFSEVEIEDIVYRYKKVLTDILGDKVFVHRAGGWCLQPFSKLSKAFKKHNIWLDSTVFEGGKNKSKTHYFDFKEVPKLASWSFESDPCKENKEGFFKEVPISSYKLSAWFFWKLAFYQKFGGEVHRNFGDGTAAGGSRWDKLRMLTRSTSSVVSIDGYKASFLEKAYKNNKYKNNFVVIGHPKSMSTYSLGKLETFIVRASDANFTTYQKEFYHEI